MEYKYLTQKYRVSAAVRGISTSVSDYSTFSLAIDIDYVKYRFAVCRYVAFSGRRVNINFRAFTFPSPFGTLVT